MDAITELKESTWNVIDMIQNSLGSQEYFLNDQKRWAFSKEIKENPEWYEDFSSYKEVMKVMISLYSMYKEAKKRGFVLYDLRAQNIGLTKDGNLVHFDIGDEY